MPLHAVLRPLVPTVEWMDQVWITQIKPVVVVTPSMSVVHAQVTDSATLAFRHYLQCDINTDLVCSVCL